jgi:hypothetical protein
MKGRTITKNPALPRPKVSLSVEQFALVLLCIATRVRFVEIHGGAMDAREDELLLDISAKIGTIIRAAINARKKERAAAKKKGGSHDTRRSGKNNRHTKSPKKG